MRAPLAFHWILFSGWAAMDSASATSASRWPGRPRGRRGARRPRRRAWPARRRPRPAPWPRARRGRRRPGRRRVCSRSLASALAGLLGAEVGVRHPLQQQLGGGQQLVVLAGEVGQRLGGGGAGVGADLALALGGADEDGAVVVHPAELGGAVTAGGVQAGQRRRAGRRWGRGRGGSRRGEPARGSGARRAGAAASGASVCSVEGVCSDTRSGLLLGDSNLEDADRLVGRRVAALVGRLGARGGDLVHDIHAAGDPPKME